MIDENIYLGVISEWRANFWIVQFVFWAQSEDAIELCYVFPFYTIFINLPSHTTPVTSHNNAQQPSHNHCKHQSDYPQSNHYF